MWVEFEFSNTPEGTRVRCCNVGEETFELDTHLDQENLQRYLAEKLNTDVASAAAKGTAKVNMRLDDFNDLIRPSTHHQAQLNTTLRSSTDMTSLLSLLERQQSQLTQQQDLMMTLVKSLSVGGSASHPLPRPDNFDGSANAEAWILSFENACERNAWVDDEEKIINLGAFVFGTARKWYDLHLVRHRQEPWQSWKVSFLSSFGDNKVYRWDDAITYKYDSGSPVEYYFEKLRLLQLAEPNLPDLSAVALLLLGFPNDVRHVLQIRSPQQPEDLLHCIRDLGGYIQPPRTQTMQPYTNYNRAPPPRGEGRRSYDRNLSSRVALQSDESDPYNRDIEAEQKNE